MKLLKARKQLDRIDLSIHLDETKTVEDGSPDPEWVREFTWAADPPAGVSEADYLKSIKREAKLLCQQELDATQATGVGAALPGEGQAL